MKESNRAHPHTHQPEQTQPQQESRYRVEHYGKSRNFAAYEGHTLIAVTLYRKGAVEITTRLDAKDHQIAALKSELASLSQSQVSPALPFAEPAAAPPWTPPRQLAFISAEDMPAYHITSPYQRPTRTRRRA